MERLVEGGYKWTDLYTQCVLGNVLLAFELNQHYDSNFCQHKARPAPTGSFPLEEEEQEDVGSIPESRQENDLFKGYDYDEGDDDGGNLDFLNPKRSEDPLAEFYSRRVYLPEDTVTDQSGALDFVTVHKYQKNRKRQSLIGQLRQNLDSSRSREEEEEDEVESRAKDFLNSLTTRELDLLKAIVNDGYDYEDGSEEINAEDQGQDEVGEEEESNSDLQPNFDLEQKRGNVVDLHVPPNFSNSQLNIVGL